MVAQADRAIDAHRVAEAEGKGVVLTDGKLIARLHVENAGRLASKAAAILELESASG